MEQCPKDRCVWASGGICVFPCMDKADYNRAMREHHEREEQQRLIQERADRRRYLNKIEAYSTPGCNRLRTLLRRFGVRNIEDITATQAKEYYYELKETGDPHTAD